MRKKLDSIRYLGLLPSSHTSTGYIGFEKHNLLTLNNSNLSSLRGKHLGFIPQDPSFALNPLIPVGKQLIEGLRYHKQTPKQKAYQEGIEWLKRVEINDPQLRMQQYPYELSGGIKQRILIAMALICNPSLLIADEPTTALDATTQVQIMDLLQCLQLEKKMSLLLITHDLGIVAHYCQRVIVMQAGRIAEIGSVEKVFEAPQHPYTQTLLEYQRSLEKPIYQNLNHLNEASSHRDKNSSCCSFFLHDISTVPIYQKQRPFLSDRGASCKVLQFSKESQ